MEIYGKKELSMKGVIFTGAAFTGIACAAIVAAGSASAASIDKPVILADLDSAKIQRVELNSEEQAPDALLKKAKQDQRESLLKAQRRQLEQFRKQAEKTAESEAQEGS